MTTTASTVRTGCSWCRSGADNGTTRRPAAIPAMGRKAMSSSLILVLEPGGRGGPGHSLTSRLMCKQSVCALSVSSNEPTDGPGDGHTAPDWEVVDAHHVLLRAERAPK